VGAMVPFRTHPFAAARSSPPASGRGEVAFLAACPSSFVLSEVEGRCSGGCAKRTSTAGFALRSARTDLFDTDTTSSFVLSEVEGRCSDDCAKRPSTTRFALRSGRTNSGGRSWRRLASRPIRSQSPAMSASFFARVHPLIRRSKASASYRVGTASHQTSSTGRLRLVQSQQMPCWCCHKRASMFSV
jgi:hypothetical protein